MTNQERLAYAMRMVADAVARGDEKDIYFWIGYRDAVIGIIIGSKIEHTEDLSDGALD